jgi:hypothetical protein
MIQNILYFSAADARAMVPKDTLDMAELKDIVDEIKACASTASRFSNSIRHNPKPRRFISVPVIEHLKKRGFSLKWDEPYGWFIGFDKSEDDWGEE